MSLPLNSTATVLRGFALAGLLLASLLLGTSAGAQTPPPPPLTGSLLPGSPPTVSPLTATEATQCRAVAEALRDRQYAHMRNLIDRVERTPNLSAEALLNVEKQIHDAEANIKTAEAKADRFAFASAPDKTMTSQMEKDDTAVLTPKLDACLKALPAPAKN